MNKNNLSATLVLAAGAFVGLLLGCLVTWYPIRLMFCAAYHTPDCEEIVLMLAPFYCLVAPLAGVITAGLLYRRKRKLEARDGVLVDGASGEEDGEKERGAGEVEEVPGREVGQNGDAGLAQDDDEAAGGVG